MGLTVDNAMWFLPSALNVKVKEFNQARVNGGSNYDSQLWKLQTTWKGGDSGKCTLVQYILCLLVDLTVKSLWDLSAATQPGTGKPLKCRSLFESELVCIIPNLVGDDLQLLDRLDSVRGRSRG